MNANSLPDETHVPARLKRDKTFQPCLVESGDEHYANGFLSSTSLGSWRISTLARSDSPSSVSWSITFPPTGARI
jgi:hypothetical protein